MTWHHLLVWQTRCFTPLCPLWTENPVCPVMKRETSTVIPCLLLAAEETATPVHPIRQRRQQSDRWTRTFRTETDTNLTRWDKRKPDQVSLPVGFNIIFFFYLFSWQKAGWDTQDQDVEYWACRWLTGGSAGDSQVTKVWLVCFRYVWCLDFKGGPLLDDWQVFSRYLIGELCVSGTCGVWTLKEHCSAALSLKLDSTGSALRTTSIRWHYHLQVSCWHTHDRSSAHLLKNNSL